MFDLSSLPSFVLGGVVVVGLWFAVVAIKDGVPKACSAFKAWWTQAETEVKGAISAVEAEVATLKTKVEALETEVAALKPPASVKS